MAMNVSAERIRLVSVPGRFGYIHSELVRLNYRQEIKPTQASKEQPQRFCFLDQYMY